MEANVIKYVKMRCGNIIFKDCALEKLVEMSALGQVPKVVKDLCSVLAGANEFHIASCSVRALGRDYGFIIDMTHIDLDAAKEGIYKEKIVDSWAYSLSMKSPLEWLWDAEYQTERAKLGFLT